MIAPLRRHKIEGMTLIVPAGEDPEEGVRWQVNEKLVKKMDLKVLLSEMGI